MDAIYPTILRDNDLRLITLSPGRDKAVIVCRLTTYASETELPPYEALSYTWGNPSITAPIILNGSKFRVTVNLQHALQGLRHPDKPRTLWIDALCINQSHIKERNKHVHRMGEIYSSASNVTVWLGRGTEDSDNALNFINYIEEISASTGTEKTIPRHILHPKHTPQWISFFRLVNRPWFSRRWIIQEIALAKNAVLYCGSKSTPWKFLEFVLLVHASCAKEFSSARLEYYQILGVADTIKEEGLSHLYAIRLKNACRFVRDCLPMSPHPADALLTAMLESIGSKSMDPRDGIYAFLSMANDKHTPNKIIVDYGKSEIEVFREFVEYVIESTNALDVIYFPWVPEVDVSKVPLPSWMPRPLNVGPYYGNKEVFMEPHSFDTCTSNNTSFRYYFNASRSSSPRISISQHNNDTLVLEATGFQLARVSQIGEAPKSANLIPNSWLLLAQESSHVKYGDTSDANIRAHEDLWRTLATNRTYTGDTIDKPDQWSAVFKQLVTESGSNDLDLFDSVEVYQKFGLQEGVGIGTLNNFFVRAQQTTVGKRLFATEDGNLGLGPVDIRVGDAIFILLGCHVPVILRAVDEHYTLVGDCYLHGDAEDGPIMEGGAMGFPEERYEELLIH